MPPIVIAAGIAAGGAVAGGVIGAKGASNAAKTMENATNSSNALQWKMYNQNRADLAPYREAGYGALNQLRGLTGPNGELLRNFSAADFQADPGYQFRLSEGMKALERSSAARGDLFSGGTLKALDRYNQDFASNEYQNAFNRYNTNQLKNYNILAGMAGLGQVSVGQGVQAGQNTANNIAQNTITGAANAANARASGYNAMGQAIGGAVGNIGNAFLLNALMKQNQAPYEFTGYNG